MTISQQLQLEFANVPTGAPQVCSFTTVQLTSRQSDSAARKILGCNNAEVDQRGFCPGRGIRPKVPANVFVLSYKNKPLMPCSPRKARTLLKAGKAVVVSSRPFFTIKLTSNTGGAK